MSRPRNRGSSTAQLAGTLTVELLSGFTPELGDSFDVVVATGVTGNFSQLQLPSLAPGLTWHVQTLNTGLRLRVVLLDGDGDGVPYGSDNCSDAANPSQCDSDGDGYGNRCDGDMNNNSVTNSQDYVLFRAQVGAPSVAPAYNKADINCNGVVNSQDYVLFRGLIGAPPGPGVGP